MNRVYRSRYARRSRLKKQPTDPASAHGRQLKEQKSQSRKEGNIVRQGENLGAFRRSALWLRFPKRRV